MESGGADYFKKLADLDLDYEQIEIPFGKKISFMATFKNPKPIRSSL